MTLATILVPTFDHGPTLRFSIASALAQTVRDLEVFVVGDGAPPVSREICASFAARDPRVRYFENPKGPRHGEIHRHAAMQQATGRIVCYLSDDDLFLPEHVEKMASALERAEFAHTLPVSIKEAGSIHTWPADLGRADERDAVISQRRSVVPLSCAAHTMALYRRLPHGWRTTPDDTRIDRYFWAQLLSQPGVHAVSTRSPTALHFPSPLRAGWTPERRAAELEAWMPRIAEARWRKRFERRVLRWSGLRRPWLRRWVDAVRGARAAR